jgi:hypothetical protein
MEVTYSLFCPYIYNPVPGLIFYRVVRGLIGISTSKPFLARTRASLSPSMISAVRPLTTASLSLRHSFFVTFGGGFNFIFGLCFVRLRVFYLSLKLCLLLLFGEKPLLVVMGNIDIHAVGSPLGATGSAQLAPLHVITFGGVLDGIGDLDQHPGTIFL